MNYKLAQQHILETAVRNIFSKPSAPLDIHCNARNIANLVNHYSGIPLEIDVYIPQLKLGFEYQDYHHYIPKWYANDPLQTYQFRDGNGDTLICIPFWWDQRIDSLKATIKNTRPDITFINDGEVHASPIPPLPPTEFFTGSIPVVGELMIPTFATSTTNLAKWWISEKYDGLRALWNPLSNKLYPATSTSCLSLFRKYFRLIGYIYSRQGRELFILYTVHKHFVPDFLDGEIWFGRGEFNTSARISFKNLSLEIRWDLFRFIVFDNPTTSQSHIQFEKRVIPIYVRSQGNLHLRKMLNDIICTQGEGTILRQPQALYTPGRSAHFLKLKKQKDTEALVVKVTTIEGHLNYVCKLKNGTLFKAGTNYPKLRPKVGDVISVMFSSHLNGEQEKLKDPIIYRIRKDLMWMDCFKSTPESSKTPLLNAQSHSTIEMLLDHPLSNAHHGHWSKHNSENVRAFFDSFALHRLLDPLKASTWYNTSYSDFINAGGEGIRKHHSTSFYQAILDTYPEISSVATSLVSKDNMKAHSPKYLLYRCMQAENEVRV